METYQGTQTDLLKQGQADFAYNLGCASVLALSEGRAAFGLVQAEASLINFNERMAKSLNAWMNKYLDQNFKDALAAKGMSSEDFALKLAQGMGMQPDQWLENQKKSFQYRQELFQNLTTKMESFNEKLFSDNPPEAEQLLALTRKLREIRGEIADSYAEDAKEITGLVHDEEDEKEYATDASQLFRQHRLFGR